MIRHFKINLVTYSYIETNIFNLQFINQQRMTKFQLSTKCRTNLEGIRRFKKFRSGKLKDYNQLDSIYEGRKRSEKIFKAAQRYSSERCTAFNENGQTRNVTEATQCSTYSTTF